MSRGHQLIATFALLCAALPLIYGASLLALPQHGLDGEERATCPDPVAGFEAEVARLSAGSGFFAGSSVERQGPFRRTNFESRFACEIVSVFAGAAHSILSRVTFEIYLSDERALDAFRNSETGAFAEEVGFFDTSSLEPGEKRPGSSTGSRHHFGCVVVRVFWTQPGRDVYPLPVDREEVVRNSFGSLESLCDGLVPKRL